MAQKQHWENVYTEKAPSDVSWFQEHVTRSLEIIQRLQPDRSAHIIDVGGGEATLVDDLLDLGYKNISVMDLSGVALDVAKKRLGPQADNVQWIEGDVTTTSVPHQGIDVWHDRAVFHFLVDKDDRKRYVDNLLAGVRPGGHVVIATFAEDGPERCSGLPVQRYSAALLHETLGPKFELLGQEKECHKTPFGTTQNFLYCYFRVQ